MIAQAPTGTTMTLRALARFPDRRAFVWDGGSLTYRGALDLIGRLQAAMVAAGVRKGQTAAFLSANSAETWCAGVAALGLGLIATWLHPLGAIGDHLEVIEDAEASVLIVDPSTHAQRGGELAAKAAAPRDRAHHGQGGLRARRDGGGRQDRRGDAGRSHQCRRLCHHQLHRRHDRQVQGRDPAASLQCGVDAGDRGRLRVSRGAALSCGGAHHPRLGHQGDARAAARRHGASPEGLRAGKVPGHHRAREDQFHADGADHDLRAARSSEARADRPVVAGADPVRRLADVADAAGRGAGAHRPGVQPALRPDRMLSRERSAAGPTTTPAGPSCSPRAASPSPRAASACATTTTTR